jgi:hypothetical protein
MLGEKAQYYCSSSESEDEEEGDHCYNDEKDPEDRRVKSGASKEPSFIPEANVDKYNGRCTNTGPKGVVQDWRRFKQLENEKRDEQEKERLALARKLAVTCRSQLDDESEAAKDAAFMQQLETEFDDIDELFLKEYQQKRVEELRRTYDAVPKFGKVHELSTAGFVDEIDKEQASVIIIVHIYEKGMAACDSMNRCLDCLAADYPSVKFCRIRASEARLSINFAVSGLPALLVYKQGELIGNFVRLVDEFGQDVYPADVESFLIEHSLLPDQPPLQTSSIKSSAAVKSNDDSDSDFDVD